MQLTALAWRWLASRSVQQGPASPVCPLADQIDYPFMPKQTGQALTGCCSTAPHAADAAAAPWLTLAYHKPCRVAIAPFARLQHVRVPTALQGGASSGQATALSSVPSLLLRNLAL